MKMTQLLRNLAFAALVSAILPAVQAKDAAPAAPAPAKAPVLAARPLPYAGVVDGVDKAKQTFMFKENAGERTFVVTATTKIENRATKTPVPAKFDDIKLGEYVTGSYVKNGTTLEAHSVHLGKTAPVKGVKKPTVPTVPAAPGK